MARLVHRLDEEDEPYRRAMRRERLIRDRRNPFDIYDETELYEHFRLGRDGIFSLVRELEVDVEHGSARNAALPAIYQILIALRFYASGCFQNLVSDMVNVDRTTACRAIRRVSLALQRRIGQYIYMQRQQNTIEHNKQAFYELAGFPNVIACVDGTHIKIQAPSEHEWEFVNRKGYHSINVQIMCDSNLRIVNWVAKWPGATHDARMLRESLIYRHFKEGQMTGIVLGDSGYPLKEWLMVPFINPASDADRRYNTAHMSTRNSVERCIGVWKRRFSCLHTGLRMAPERSCTVIIATAVLHNFCINRGEPLALLEDADAAEAALDADIQVGRQDVSGRIARQLLVQQYFMQ